MLKRVSSTRNVVCRALLALAIVALVAVAPAFAREDLSVGQSGDPGDGSEVAESGGSIAGTANGGAQNLDYSKVWNFVLIPIWGSGILVFQIVVLSTRREAGQ